MADEAKAEILLSFGFPLISQLTLTASPQGEAKEMYDTHSAAAERKASRSVWIIEESKVVETGIFLPRRAAAARFLCLSSTAGDAFFLFFHEKEKKEWGAERVRIATPVCALVRNDRSIRILLAPPLGELVGVGHGLPAVPPWRMRQRPRSC